MVRKLLNIVLLFAFIVGALTVNGQSRSISGRITSSDDGASLPGVSVRLKGTSIGTQTGAAGQFSISVAGNTSVLVISYVGYVTKEVPVGSRSVINVALVSDTKQLGEVVVVAYGTAKKEAYTGSMAQVKSEDIEKRPVTNAINALAGAAPGVTLNSASGQPGSAPSIRIRGIGSANASNSPLYVVDGVPFSGSIANLNTNDIESMSVLKDAAASSLYGARAANGVVIITTKKGRMNNDRTDVRISQGIVNRGIPEYERVNAYEYYPLMWEARRNSLVYNSGQTLAAASTNATNGIKGLLGYNPFKDIANNAIVGTDGKLNPDAKLLPGYADDLDWAKYLQRTGHRTDVNLGFSGATDKNDYFMSMGYLNEKGYVLKSDYQRFTGRINYNHQVKKWLKSGLNLAGTVTRSTQSATPSDGGTSYNNPFYFSRNIGPIYPVYVHDLATGDYVTDANGKKIYDLGGMTAYGLPARPAGASNGRHVLAETELNKEVFKRNALSGRTYLEATFLKDFKLRVNASVDISNYWNAEFENTLVGDGAPAGRGTRNSTITTDITLNELLTYTKALDQHHIEVLAGHENYDYTYNYLNGVRQGLAIGGLDELINFTTTNELLSYKDKYKTEGYFSRLNYDYADKYFLSGSFRRDGSSRFYEKNRWGNFWSVGGGWRLDKEDFMKLSWVDLLKIRSSYGQVGNDAVLTQSGNANYYSSQLLYNLDNNNALEPGVALQEVLGNQSIEWEKNSQFDIGTDFSFFKGRLGGSLEYFNRTSDNLLFFVPLPLSSGVISQIQNIGSMSNKGWELALNGTPVKSKGFEWNIDLNITTIKNEVTKLPQKEIVSGTKKLMVGHSYYDYWLRDWYGVDPSDGAGLFVATPEAATDVRTVNGVKVTTNQNNAAYHYAGTALPDYYGSFNNTFSYKGFSLSTLFTYQIGGKIYDGVYANLMHSGTYGTALHKDMLNRWQKEGDKTGVPRMDNSKTSVFGSASDRWLIDASYIALKTATLNYTLPVKLSSRLNLKNANVYVSGENLFQKSKRKGLDASQAFSGVTSNYYQPARIVTLGLNVSL
ncbi:SusC/RagA family TonB-linked outer membrane protein [Arcticibacter sp. MXS-1]|uniref:SusC/RagA family TonB-linked outer membrane protein n=1 Tax=Arcticibacter sp. MXS-1 TaxID=3341726 RepID=UPI0035A8D813